VTFEAISATGNLSRTYISKNAMHLQRILHTELITTVRSHE